MTKQKPVGQCRLCKLVNELCDSHYLPKRLYAFGRAKQLKNPNPIMSINGTLKQISDQYRGYAFCYACEDVLNNNGERWVLANLPQDYDDPFPLRDALGPLTPTVIEKDRSVYNVSANKIFDLNKLVYFAMSIFWRGAAYQWKSSSGQEAPTVDLSSYQEPMRKFIVGTDPFPNDVVLTVDIWPYKRVLQVSYPALDDHLPECQRYWFYVPGLLFFLHLGAGIPQNIRLASASGGIVTLDCKTADSIINYTTQGIKSSEMGSKMNDMLQEIAAIRSKAPPK